MASAWGISWGSAWGNSWGAVATVERTKGGAAPSVSERRRKAREAELRQVVTTKPEREPWYYEALPEDVSEITKDVVTGGRVFVGDTEVELQSLPEPPRIDLLEQLAPLSEIRDEVEREIAEMIRLDTADKYRIELERYENEVRSFEEELMVFLLLVSD